MNLGTRDRLLEAAADLFARHGYRGASVRRICDLARANPGAVSYHFGGKRQLYRTVLRRAAAVLSRPEVIPNEGDGDIAPLKITEVVSQILDRLNDNQTATRVLLRDLADGGDVAVEALEPTLRSAFEGLSLAIGEDSAPRGSSTGRALFLDLAAPLFLLTAAWPVLQRSLNLDPDQRRSMLVTACRRTLEVHGYPELG
jgi:AcrR family transcriptional regulator